VAKERKASGAANAAGAKSGEEKDGSYGQAARMTREIKPSEPISNRDGLRTSHRAVYELPKSGHSDLVTLLALRERPPFDDEYVDTQTLALVHKLSASYFEKLRVRGGGPPYVRIGSQVRYRFGDAKRWASERFARNSTSDLDRVDAA
jgi:hypothetical protein